MVSGIAMVAAIALAGWSWLTVVRRGGPFRRREATVLTAWAGLSGTGRLIGVLAGPDPTTHQHELGNLIALVGSGLALVAVAQIVRRITAGIGGLGAAVAESALTSTSLITLAWVVTNAALEPPPAAVLAVAPAMFDLASATLVLRLAVLIPTTAAGGGNRRRLVLAAVTVGLVVAGDALLGLCALGIRTPNWIVDVLIGLGFGVAAAIPRFGSITPVITRRRAPGLRVLPYLLVCSAVVAVCIQALTSQTGPVPMVLVTLVVASLIALQAFTLNENDQLLSELTQSRIRLTALVENTSDLIVRLDVHGRVQAANAAAIRLLHRTPASLTGRPFDDLAQAEDRRRVREVVLEVTRGRQQAAQVELRLAAPAAGTAQLRLRAVDGGAVANLNDVTDAVELRQRLERLARYDQMTGLVNRSHLLEVIGAWLGEPELDVAVLYADLDGFKAVNDRFGHSAGDRVLKEVASRFDALSGAVDARRVIVGRVGGDEFIMGLEGIGPDAALIAAHRVVEAITPSFVIGDRTVQLGVSVGVSGAGRWTTSASATAEAIEPVTAGELGAAELVHRADLAMYAAKASGRAQVASWDPRLEEQARRRVDIAIGLRGALDTGRLAVAYQPIVRLSDGVVIGAEALLRLPAALDPALLAPGLDALVSPAELVAVAEDNGTILEMGEWVLAQAAREAAEWARAGHDATVSVNMSVQQLVSPNFVDSVWNILSGCGLSPSLLVLELTESQLVGHTGPALQQLERLRAAGIRLAIDDFGTGYSSLSYLRHLPVQLVKMDRTLLDDVGVDPRATALVRSVLGMTRDLGLRVVAEGMEDMQSVRLLRSLGAYCGQGFALSTALPAERMAQVLAGPPVDLNTDTVPAIPLVAELVEPVLVEPVRVERVGVEPVRLEPVAIEAVPAGPVVRSVNGPGNGHRVSDPETGGVSIDTEGRSRDGVNHA